MIKLVSKQQPMTKIGTKEKELKYVLNLVLSGSISEKEVIEFACKHTGMQPTMVKAAIESCLQIVELYIALGYSVICYPHHQNFRCLTCKTPLLDNIPPQSHWGSPPNPLGTPPKPFGEPSQTLWETFPNPLGNLPKPFGEPFQTLWGGCQSTM